jgi:hypothetical protein
VFSCQSAAIGSLSDHQPFTLTPATGATMAYPDVDVKDRTATYPDDLVLSCHGHSP